MYKTKLEGGILQWVSEWRIEGNDWTKYKVSNGGVYSPTDDLDKAKEMLRENIKQEQRAYRANWMKCPNCNIRFAEHGHGMDMERCLFQLAFDGVRK